MTPSVEIKKGLVLRNSASSLAYHLLRLSVLVWLNEFLLERISTEEYSLLPIVIGVMAFAPVMSELLTGGAARYVTEAYAVGDERRVTEIVSSLLPVLFAGAALMLGLGAVFCWKVDAFLDISPGRVGEAQLMVALMLASTAFQLVLVPYCVGLHVRQRFVLLNGLQLAQEVVRNAVLFALLFGIDVRIQWVVVANVIGIALGFTARFVVSRRLMPALRFERALANMATAKEMLRFGSWTSLGSLAAMIQNGAPPLLLNRLGSPLQVACFHLGSLATRQIRQLGVLVSAPLQPVLTAMYSTGESDRLRSLYVRGGRIFLWLTLLPAVPAALFAGTLIELYTEAEYASSATVMALLLAMFPFEYASTMLYRVVLAKARLRRFFLWAVGAQVAAVVSMLAFLLTTDLGAVGVALGMLGTSIVVHACVFWPMGLHVAEVSLARFVNETLRPGLTPAAFSAALCLLWRATLPLDNWLDLFLASAVSAVVYLAALFLLSLQPADRRDLLSVAERVRLRRA